MSGTAVSRRLARQEAIIERNLAAFLAVGRALLTIREEELYREAGFDGFVEYLDAKPWEIGRAHAYRMIDAAAVAEVVSPIGEINEGQARELARLNRHSTPEVVREVYAEAVEESNGRPTAAVIREKVQAILPPREPRPQPPRPMTVDLRPEGLAATTTAIINHVRALGLIRGNVRAEADELETVIRGLEWAAEELAATVEILKRGGDQ